MSEQNFGKSCQVCAGVPFFCVAGIVPEYRVVGLPLEDLAVVDRRRHLGVDVRGDLVMDFCLPDFSLDRCRTA